MATNYCNPDDRKLAQFAPLLLGSDAATRNEVAIAAAAAATTYEYPALRRREIKYYRVDRNRRCYQQTGHRAADCRFYHHGNVNG